MYKIYVYDLEVITMDPFEGVIGGKNCPFVMRVWEVDRIWI